MEASGPHDQCMTAGRGAAVLWQGSFEGVMLPVQRLLHQTKLVLVEQPPWWKPEETRRRVGSYFRLLLEPMASPCVHSEQSLACSV